MQVQYMLLSVQGYRIVCSQGRFSLSCYIFNDRWSEAFCAGVAPVARSSHAAACVGNHFIIVGGQSRGRVFADSHLLDLTSLTWFQVRSCLHEQVQKNTNLFYSTQLRPLLSSILAMMTLAGSPQTATSTLSPRTSAIVLKDRSPDQWPFQ